MLLHYSQTIIYASVGGDFRSDKLVKSMNGTIFEQRDGVQSIWKEKYIDI